MGQQTRRMARRAKALTALAVAAMVAACGGGGGGDSLAALPPAPVPPAVVEAKPVPNHLLAIGNSITRHAPKADIGWTGDWGMAASEQAKDWAHLTGSALGLSVTAINMATLELDPNAAVPSFPVTPTTTVVIELGDNGMPARYSEIVSAVKGAAKLACTSTYWRFADRDAQIKSACEAAGGVYVFIGDIFSGPLGQFSNPFVDVHPGDVQMAEISRRVVAALAGK